MLTLLFCLFPALAAEPWHGYDLKSKPKVKVEKDRSAPGAEVLGDQSLDVPLPNNRALVGQRRRNLPHETPKLINWGGELSYGARTDLADQAKPRLYTHTLSLSYGFQHVPSTITLAGILGAAYDTTGGQEREVILDENDT
ncbi:MAG TPA: hypothetical protein PKC28_08870, partial [Bdellovibrionales bacterium]|nr:hypothetical protein [Bdellovibrionales bacterium]